MELKKVVKFISVLALIVLVGCLDTSSKEKPEKIPVAYLSGVAFDGLIINAHVAVYDWSAGDKGELLGEARTDDNGYYQINFISEEIPVLIEISEGHYYEEASEYQVVLTETDHKLLAVANYKFNQPLDVSVTFFSNLAAGLAKYLVSIGTPIPEAIKTANEMNNEWLGFDVAATTPVDITNSANASFRLPDSHLYGMTTAAISYYMKTVSEQNEEAVHELYNSIRYAKLRYDDIAYDGLLDGIGEEGELAMGIVPVGRDDLRHLLAVNILAMAGHENNKTKLGVERFVEHAQFVNSFSFNAFKSDAKNNISTDAPTFVSTSIDANTILSGVVNISAVITDPVGIDRIDFTIDGERSYKVDDLSNPAISVYTLSYTDGEHEMKIVAENSLGNVSELTRTFTVANRETVISELTPIEDSIVRGSITATAKLFDPLGFSKIEFLLSTKQDEAKDFTVPIAIFDTTLLSDGVHLLKVKTKNTSNFESEMSHYIQVDNTTPLITIRSPVDMQIVKDKFGLTFDLIEATGLEYFRIFINGEQVARETDNIERFEREFDVSDLDDGLHTIAVEAKDVAGNISRDSVEIYVRNVGTSIDFVTPKEGEIVNEPLTIEAKVNDPVGVSETYIKFSNYAEEEITNTTNPSFTYPNLRTKQGIQTARVRTINALGSEVSKSIDVFVDTLPPELTINQPTVMQISADTIMVDANIVDATALQYVRVLIDESVVASYGNTPDINRSVDISQLDDGLHTLTIETEDSSGNAVSDSVTFIVRNVGTSIQILDLVDGQYVPATGTFEALISDPVGIKESYFQITNGTRVYDGEPTHLVYDYNYTFWDEGERTLTVTAINNLDYKVTQSIQVKIDNTPSSITTGFPANNTYHIGDLGFTSSVADAIGVASAELLVDGQVKQSFTSDFDEIAISVNTREYEDGLHTMQLRAVDIAGNASESAIHSVYFDNTAPTASILVPVANGVYNAQFQAWFDTSDSVGLDTIVAYINGERWGGVSNVKNPNEHFVYVVPGTLGDGQHSMYIISTDKAGHQTQSETVLFTIDTTAALSSVGIGRVGLNHCNVTLTASDAGTGLQSMSLSRWNTVLATSTNGTISYNVEGGHVDELGIYVNLTASMTDNAGNTSSDNYCMYHWFNITPFPLDDYSVCKIERTIC